jgi:RNA-directed DNA polymerase
MFYKDIISVQNLLKAWEEFIRGKKNKKDVSEFSLNLSKNIFNLHYDLVFKNYIHGSYESFKINDPKPRDIHKATVRDRLLHHAFYRILYPHIDKKFIYDSYSCRNFKGTHRAVVRFREFFLKVSKNKTRTAWVLKCDIRKFFASVDQEILLKILRKHIKDEDVINLSKVVVDSFESTGTGKGLPLGNLTSQLLVNIYMNEFDQWIKHTMKIKWYIRYADDFAILHTDKRYLKNLILQISQFLQEKLKLSLHPDKVYIKTFASGVDFLGWVHFPNHRTLRTTTKKRMFKKLKIFKENERVLQSYIGLLSHGNTWKIRDKIVIGL